jgi:hypothetical protein
MTSRKAFNQPTQSAAVDGEVVLNGPDGVGLSMTPDAAEETARRLAGSAKEARAQSTGDSSGDPQP